MFAKIKHLYSLIRQSIYTGDRINKQLSIIKWTGYIITLIGAVMSTLNIIQHKGLVTYTTLAICVAGIIITISAKFFRNTKVALIASWLFCVVFFSYYTIAGTNEGFAILWTLMVPLAFGYIGGIIYGITVSLFYEVLFIVLFYTPLKHHMAQFYSETFIQRFPILYLTSILLNSITMISNHISTLMQLEYEVKLKDALKVAEEESEHARQANESKSAFLSNMSHEIRTPINAVLGMNEMILRESENDSILQYSDNIKTAGTSLLGIVNDILDFSKIEAGKMEIIPVDYTLSSLINDLANMIQTRAESKGLMLNIDIDPTIPNLLHGDEIRIKQVVTNILTNAVKYTERGSVTFGIGHEKDSEDPDSIILNVYVKDTGIGIRPEDMSKLFSEFERIEEKRNRNVEGTGLGMNITKCLLELMDTSLQVESVYGEGSTFSFKLKQKVVKPEPIGDYEQSYRNSLSERKRYKEKFTAPDATVLVVDDNDMNLIVFKSLLKKTLINVDTADDGFEGLARSREKKYDIIFLDHMMPGKDGVETLHELMEDPEDKNHETPKVCLTANAISGAREEYIEAGFDDYLTKPIDSNTLENMLMEYLPAELIKEPVEGDPVLSDANDNQEDAASSDAFSLPDELAPLSDQELIDLKCGMTNSGNADSYLSLLKVFHGSVKDKADELKRLFEEKDFENYTIKVHAIKSSARIIGATGFGEDAQKLEDAGKVGDTDYILKHHDRLMDALGRLSDLLSPVFARSERNEKKPEADQALMAEVYKQIRKCAEDMNCDNLESILEEMSDYSIPEADKELWAKLNAAIDSYDYDSIIALLDSSL